jgi:hypothetical protein
LQRKGFNFLSVFKWEDRKGWGACDLMHRKWESVYLSRDGPKQESA